MNHSRFKKSVLEPPCATLSRLMCRWWTKAQCSRAGTAGQRTLNRRGCCMSVPRLHTCNRPAKSCAPIKHTYQVTSVKWPSWQCHGGCGVPHQEAPASTHNCMAQHKHTATWSGAALLQPVTSGQGGSLHLGRKKPQPSCPCSRNEDQKPNPSWCLQLST